MDDMNLNTKAFLMWLSEKTRARYPQNKYAIGKSYQLYSRFRWSMYVLGLAKNSH